MATLVNGELHIKNSRSSRPSFIRLDWSNNRHQEIKINGNTPKAVKKALIDMLNELESEIHFNNI